MAWHFYRTSAGIGLSQISFPYLYGAHFQWANASDDMNVPHNNLESNLFRQIIATNMTRLCYVRIYIWGDKKSS